MPRGSETIKVRVEAEGDWQGDPVGPDGAWRDVKGCVLIPRTHTDDDQQIVEGYQIFVPPGETPPEAENEIQARGKTWAIDGSVGDFTKKSGADAGYLFVVRRLR